MKFAKGPDLSGLMSKDLSAEELAYEHALDISVSIYKRMKETGVTKTALAKKLGCDKSQVTRILSTHQNMTLKTIASIEIALDFRLDDGFYYTSSATTYESNALKDNDQHSSDLSLSAISVEKEFSSGSDTRHLEEQLPNNNLELGVAA
jgi:transcriptional regulator with XRE-family HTH domain